MEHNFVLRGITSFERDKVIALLRGDKRDTALVFVHGYRNSFDFRLG